MRNIVLLFLLILNGCIIDKTQYMVSYATQNTLNQSVEVLMFRLGNVEIKYQTAPQEIYSYSLSPRTESDPYGSIRESRLSTIDSVQIKFADGKIKTDYIQDYFGSTTKSIFRDEYYVVDKSCPGVSKCNQYIYTIDEQDYAEAK